MTHTAVLRQLDRLARALELMSDDRIYSWLPLYHDMGLISCFMLPMVYHIPLVMQSPTNWVIQPATMLELISEFRCSLAWVPNFALQFVARRVHEEDLRKLDLSSLRALINCSEPVRAQSIDEFVRVFSAGGLRPGVVVSSYAMAENVFAVTQSPVGSPPVRIVADARALRDEHVIRSAEPSGEGIVFVSSGRCLPGSEVRALSRDGMELPDGAIGDLVIRSDCLLSGYFNRPDLTAEAFSDGWYLTGDLGFVQDGEVFVVGRRKDLIIQGGKNIYSQDIEEIASAHPSIHDGRAVAFGLFNSEKGTEDVVLVAEVESDRDFLETSEIQTTLKGAIVSELGITVRAVYLKPPKWIVKSTAGKPFRSGTRDKLLADHPQLSSGQPLVGLDDEEMP